MTILSAVGTFSRLAPPIPPDPGFLNIDGTFFTKNLTFLENRTLPNNIIPEGIFVSSAGDRVFVIDVGGIIYQYDLSVAFDTSTISYNSVNVSVAFTTTANAHRDLFFDPSGTRLYVISDATDRILQYNLSVPWDISTTEYANKSFILNSPGESFHKALSISQDGSKFFVLGTSTDRVFEFSMTTPWDISTSTYLNRSFLFSGYETTPEGLAVTPDGRSLIIVGTTADAMFEFELASSWNLTTVEFKNRQIIVVNLQPAIKGIHYHQSGYVFTASQTNNSVSSYQLGVLELGTSPVSVINKGYKINEDVGNRVSSIRFDTYGIYMQVLKGETIYRYIMTSPSFDISNVSYTGNTYAADPQNLTLAQNIFFDPSGLKYFVVGFNNTNISQYSLNTAFTVSSPTYVANKSFLGGTGGLGMGSGAAGMGFFITPDGEKLFIGLNNATYGYGIYRADFAVPWDVTTLSTDLTKTNYKFLNSTWGLGGAIIPELTFSNDGRKLYLYDKVLKRIYQFGLSTAYSIGSAVLDNYYSIDYLDSSGFSYANFFPETELQPGFGNIVLFFGNARGYLTQFDI